MQKRRLLTILIIVILILLIPLIAMQFTDEVNWGLMDFIIAGVLLFSAGFLLDLIIKRVSNSNCKTIFYILIIVFVFFLVWAELAVGIFDTPFAGD